MKIASPLGWLDDDRGDPNPGVLSGCFSPAKLIFHGSLVGEERNQGRNTQPQKPLDKEEQESPEPQ